MQELPHHYRVAAVAQPEGGVDLSSEGLAPIESAPPEQFGGPGGLWSPETLLVAAVADCFVLSFKAVARASRLSWLSLQCEVVGTLERREGKTRFTEFSVNATLELPAGSNKDRAARMLEKAEASCLVTNSLSGVTHLRPAVVVKA